MSCRRVIGSIHSFEYKFNIPKMNAVLSLLAVRCMIIGYWLLHIPPTSPPVENDVMCKLFGFQYLSFIRPNSQVLGGVRFNTKYRNFFEEQLKIAAVYQCML